MDPARHPPTRLLRPEPHPTASELPSLAALSAPVTRPEVGVEENVADGGGGKRELEKATPRRLGGAEGSGVA